MTKLVTAPFDVDLGTFLKKGEPTHAATVTLLGIDPRGLVVEVVGPPCSGKTEVLLHHLAHTIAPAMWLGRKTQGRGRSAALIDADGHIFVRAPLPRHRRQQLVPPTDRARCTLSVSRASPACSSLA